MLRRVGKLCLGGSAIVVAVGCAFTLSPELHSQASSQSPVQVWKSKIEALDGTLPPREAHLAALSSACSPSSPLDVLVIGGGSTGCGVALDAATRGLNVGLVERDDFSSGTSSRSTKLVHGGVRYLENAFFHMDIGQLKVVFHALEERYHMLKNARHLCSTLPIMTPCYELWEIPYYWTGLKVYDLIAGRQTLHSSRFCSAKQSRYLFPTLSKNENGRTLKGTIIYYDGQFDDSRYNIALACTAALAGAAVLNHAEAEKFHRSKATGQITGVRVCDKLSGKRFDVYAKVVVNATGPFCDEVRQIADKETKPLITPSSGVHVVLPDYYSPNGMGLIVPKTKDKRVVFMLPWLGKTVAGTTDASCDITSLPEPHEEEIQFILDAIADYLCVKVRRTDVLSAWSGIRPLVSDTSSSNTANLSREHVICFGPEGLLTVTGGKWTTYRSMAEDVVDLAIKIAELEPSNECITKNLVLNGAKDWTPASFTFLTQQFIRMKRTSSGKIVPGPMDTEIAKHLSNSYGSLAHRVATIAQDEGLGMRLAHGYPYIEAEVAYCARNEYCETVVDFIARRSRLAFLDTEAAKNALPRVVEILASEHKWGRSRRKAELAQAKAFLKTFKASDNNKK